MFFAIMLNIHTPCFVWSLITDQGVVSLTSARSHSLTKIDHEVFSMVILLLPLIQEGLLSVASESMHVCALLSLSLHRKKCG